MHTFTPFLWARDPIPPLLYIPSFGSFLPPHMIPSSSQPLQPLVLPPCSPSLCSPEHLWGAVPASSSLFMTSITILSHLPCCSSTAPNYQESVPFPLPGNKQNWLSNSPQVCCIGSVSYPQLRCLLLAYVITHTHTPPATMHKWGGWGAHKSLPFFSQNTVKFAFPL